MILKKHRQATRTTLTLAAALAVIAILSIAGDALAADDEHSFHRDHVLGTSLDMKIRGVSKDQAEACCQAVLAEIQRLDKILNSRKSDSEISRLAASITKSTFKCSTDLYSVLYACKSWRIKTAGAFNANIGELSALWRAAAKTGKAPNKDDLDDAVERVGKTSWRLDSRTRTFRASRRLHLMTDGLAKGYIIDKALAAGLKQTPGAKGLLVNIGGDIACWSAPGASQWPVGIADPFNSHDNAEPMTTLSLTSGSVATSGSYSRHFKIGSKRYSHIIDPRTGRPADGVVSATVVAKDTVTADALATAMCVLTPLRGLALANRLNGVECLIVDSKGKKHTSRNWSARPPAKSSGTKTPTGAASSDQWPKGNQVTIGLTLRRNPPLRGRKKKRKYQRPYVAVMIANERGKPIKTLALWVLRKTKYDKTLRAWHGMGQSYRARIRGAVSRSTRGPGAYSLVWDGRDDDGKPVTRGTYGVLIEINREYGSHVYMRAKINCQGSPDSVQMNGNNESEGAWVKYGQGK